MYVASALIIRILKKHDKRTALTASTGFQSLARATLSKIGADGSVSTWTFYNTSLPHVLLASLTDILLPWVLFSLHPMCREDEPKGGYTGSKTTLGRTEG